MRLGSAVLLLAITVACATSGGSRAATGGRDVITREEILAANVSTAEEVVRRLRPEFLRSRGQSSADPNANRPVVYVDGVRAGGPEALRNIAANDVREIRYISAADATTRYGTGHVGGVIEVRIRS